MSYEPVETTSHVFWFKSEESSNLFQQVIKKYGENLKEQDTHYLI